MKVIFSQYSGLNNTAFGKIETPVKMIIQHESDVLTKNKGGVLDALYNVEKSNKWAETFIGNDGFDDFAPTGEGEGAKNDSIQELYKKVIEHVVFTKEFTITQTMIEDAVNGVAAEAKRRSELFVRAYYKTRNRFGSALLQGATATSTLFGGKKFDTTAPKHVNEEVALPLFHKSHKVGLEGDTQSNYFYTTDLAAGTVDTAIFESILNDISVKIRSMMDENGDPLGYTANMLVLPANLAGLETIAKKVCGSPGALGNDYNDINLNFGNWNVFVDPFWIAKENAFLVMSTDANDNLAGNMFLDRRPLTVTPWVDKHTGNNIWTGSARFGAGFGSYKHIIRVDSSASAGAASL